MFSDSVQAGVAGRANGAESLGWLKAFLVTASDENGRVVNEVMRWMLDGYETRDDS